MCESRVYAGIYRVGGYLWKTQTNSFVDKVPSLESDF